jgi:hypothetical protein
MFRLSDHNLHFGCGDACSGRESPGWLGSMGTSSWEGTNASCHVLHLAYGRLMYHALKSVHCGAMSNFYFPHRESNCKVVFMHPAGTDKSDFLLVIGEWQFFAVVGKIA